MAKVRITAEEKHSYLFRVAPQSFVQQMLMQNNDVSQWSELRIRLLTWSQGSQD